MARVLVTGATGFVGSHLVRAALKRGDRVVALARPTSSVAKIEDVSGDVALERAEFTDADALRAVLDRHRPDLIFHSAAATRLPVSEALTDLRDSVAENLTPLLGVLTAAATCKSPPRALIRLGTIAEYGDCPVPYAESSNASPRDSYGASMLAGTKYLEMLRPRLPFAAMTARLSLTYGPGQTGAQLVPYLIDRLMSGETAQIGRPDDARDFLHVDDAVRALLLLGDAPDSEIPVVNISTGIPTRVRDVVAMLADLTGARPDQVQLGTAGAAIDLVNDPALIKSRYSWAPQIPLADGLKQTVAWVRKSKQLASVTGQDA